MYSDLGKRKLIDMRQWNPMVGKNFWQTHPLDPTKGRTIWMHYNVFAYKLKPQITDWNASTKPDRIKEINARPLSLLMM